MSQIARQTALNAALNDAVAAFCADYPDVSQHTVCLALHDALTDATAARVEAAMGVRKMRVTA